MCVIGSVVIVALGSVVLTLFSFQSYGQILGAFEYFSHAVMYKFLLFYEFFRFGVLPKLYSLDQDMFELVGKTVGCFDFDVRVSDAHQISDQLRGERGTLVSVVLRMLLNASIFHLAKSPGNSCPNMERAEMILIVLALSSAYVLGRYLYYSSLTICCYTPPSP